MTKVSTTPKPAVALKRITLLKFINPVWPSGWLWLVALLPLLALTTLPQPTGLSSVLRPALPIRPDTIPGEDTPNQLRTVVIDAGHGGKDPGTHGRDINEKTVVLRIALALGRIIKEESPRTRVIYTRSSDRFIELNERSAIANRNQADLFISIHCNASPSSHGVYGTETYTMGLHKTEGNLDVARRENSVILQEANYQRTYKGFDPNSPLAHIMLANYQHAFMGSSIRFAQKLEHSFRRNGGRASRGVKQAGFLVLWRTTMPSVLIETGYLTNTDEEQFLSSSDGQEAMAQAIYKAFVQYKSEIEGG